MPEDPAGQALRKAILAASDALFYENGIAGVSIDAIARRAGVTRRTLYYHFAGKDPLVVEHVKMRDRSIRAAAASGSVIDAFKTLDDCFVVATIMGARSPTPSSPATCPGSWGA